MWHTVTSPHPQLKKKTLKDFVFNFIIYSFYRHKNSSTWMNILMSISFFTAQFPSSVYNNMHTALHRNTSQHSPGLWKGGGFNLLQVNSWFSKGAKLHIVSYNTGLWGFRGRGAGHIYLKVHSRCKWTFALLLSFMFPTIASLKE